MSIQSRYLHTLVVKRMAASPSVDDYGQPLVTETTVATVKGLVQPRRAREVALASQAGAVIGDWVGYCAPTPLITSECWLEVSDVRYDVLAVADAGGVGHHLELDLRRVS